MGAEPGKGREGNRQVPMVCLGFLNRSSGTVGQIVASGMPVESRKNLAIVELRNAPHPYTRPTPQGNPRECLPGTG